ncbi:MAG: D-alanine--D-alanine ligase [Solirubrobacterales bacterium]|nr:D-alanine--D-alanine ligase [Solirubrobacterales bacterium]
MTLIAVLKGGRSLERQVSLKSGARVEEALRALGHEVVGIDVGPNLVARLAEVGPELAFIALHGRDGEDGTVQELLEVLQIPYTGSDAAACVRASDKVLTKQALRDAGLPTADFFFFSEGSFQSLGAGEALSHVQARLGFPIVIKPAGQGSSLGIKFAANSTQLPTGLIAAFSYDRKVLLERFIDGRDLAVGIVDGVGVGSGPQALPVVEALPQPDAEDSGTAYDYEHRYEIGRTRFVCPAEIGDELSARAAELALATYAELGCAGFARVDLMLERGSDELFVLECNSIPGLTETSLLPQAADVAGIGFEALIERIVACALA